MLDAQCFCLQCGRALQNESQDLYCSEKCSTEADLPPASPSPCSPVSLPALPNSRSRSQRTIRARVLSTQTIRQAPVPHLRQSSPATPVRVRPDPSFSLLSDASASRIHRWVADVQRELGDVAPSHDPIHSTHPFHSYPDHDTSTEDNSDLDDAEYFFARPRHKSRHSCPADLRSSLSNALPMSPTAVLSGSALAPAVSTLTPTYAIMSAGITAPAPPTDILNEKVMYEDEDLTPPARLASEYGDSKRALELALVDTPVKSPTQKAQNLVFNLVRHFLNPSPSESGVKLRVGITPRKNPTSRPRAHTTGQVDYMRPSYQTLTVTSQTPTSLPIATPEDLISELNLDPVGIQVPGEEEFLLYLRNKASGGTVIPLPKTDRRRSKIPDMFAQSNCTSTSPIRIPKGEDSAEAHLLSRGRPMDRDFRRRSISNAHRD